MSITLECWTRRLATAKAGVARARAARRGGWLRAWRKVWLEARG